MRPGPTDTSPEAEQVLREAYRRMPFERRWRQMGAIYETAKALHAAAVRSRNSKMPGNDVLAVLREVSSVLSRMNIPYALVGGWASSLLGKMRFTHDADLTVEPFPGKEPAFCTSFGDEYSVSLPAAVRGYSFTILHTPSGFSVDLFVRKARPFEESVMRRRQAHSLAGDPDQTIHLVSAEDIILLKLEWHGLGREASERQWRDVLGVLEVQAERLDHAYLDTWATSLAVADLLERARQESKL